MLGVVSVMARRGPSEWLFQMERAIGRVRFAARAGWGRVTWVLRRRLGGGFGIRGDRMEVLRVGLGRCAGLAAFHKFVVGGSWG